MNLTNDRLLTKDEAAELLRISPRTLDYWREGNALPCVRRKGYVRFLLTDIEEFLRHHRGRSQDLPSAMHRQ